MSTTLQIKGTVLSTRAHSIRWDVREITMDFDTPTIVMNGWPRTSILVHDDWNGCPADGFSAFSGDDRVEVL